MTTEEEWVAYYESKGFVLRGPDEAPDPSDFVVVSNLRESGPEFLHDEGLRFRRPDQIEGEQAVTSVKLIAKRAPDGGYGIYTVNDVTHDWKLICGYGPGVGAFSILALVIQMALEDEAAERGEEFDVRAYERRMKKWRNSFALYGVCSKLAKRVRDAQKEERNG